jgi:hypothetical protein
LSFGSVTTGSQSAEQTFQVTNTGTGALTSEIRVGYGPYIISTPCAAVLPAGGSCTVGVKFVPFSNGPVNGAVAVSFTELASATFVFLDGSGVSGSGYTYSASATPTSLNLGSVTIGLQSSEQTFQVTNTGTGALTSEIRIGYGPYIISTPCAAVLPAGASCTVGVKFVPFSNGPVNGAVAVSFTELASATFVYLNGTGM